MIDTTIGWETRLCFWMIVWIVRAKMSVPPPAPAVTTNSIGFDGVKAVASGMVAVARAPAIASPAA